MPGGTSSPRTTGRQRYRMPGSRQLARATAHRPGMPTGATTAAAGKTDPSRHPSLPRLVRTWPPRLPLPSARSRPAAQRHPPGPEGGQGAGTCSVRALLRAGSRTLLEGGAQAAVSSAITHRSPPHLFWRHPLHAAVALAQARHGSRVLLLGRGHGAADAGLARLQHQLDRVLGLCGGGVNRGEQG